MRKERRSPFLREANKGCTVQLQEAYRRCIRRWWCERQNHRKGSLVAKGQDRTRRVVTKGHGRGRAPRQSPFLPRTIFFGGVGACAVGKAHTHVVTLAQRLAFAAQTGGRGRDGRLWRRLWRSRCRCACRRCRCRCRRRRGWRKCRRAGGWHSVGCRVAGHAALPRGADARDAAHNAGSVIGCRRVAADALGAAAGASAALAGGGAHECVAPKGAAGPAELVDLRADLAEAGVDPEAGGRGVGRRPRVLDLVVDEDLQAAHGVDADLWMGEGA